ncbi:MAG: caspase family protein [Planctomycetaceae bacterium]
MVGDSAHALASVATKRWRLVDCRAAGVERGSRGGAEPPRLAIDARGHTATVNKVLFTPDGNELISVSDDKTIRLWDVASGEPLRTLRTPIGDGEEGKLYAAALSPNGDWLAVGGMYRIPTTTITPIYLISLPRLQVVRLLKGHENTITDLAFSADSQRLISGSGDNTAQVWRVADGQCEFVLRGHTEGVFGVAFAPDGQRCATASLDDTAALWSIPADGNAKTPRDGQRLAMLRGHRDDVRYIAWSPDGKRLATASNDNTLRLWDVGPGARPPAIGNAGQSGSPSFEAFNEIGKITSVTFSVDSQRLLYTTQGSRNARPIAGLLDVSSGRTVVAFDKHATTVLGGSLSRDSRLAATIGGTENEVFVWQTSDGRVRQKLAGLGRFPFSAAWNPEGTAIAWGNKSTDTEVNASRPLERAFDVRALEWTAGTTKTSEFSRFLRARVEHGNTKLQGSSMTTVDVLHRGQEPTTLRFSNDYERQYNRVNCFSLLSEERAVVGASGGLYLFDVRTGLLLHNFQGHTGAVVAVSSSSDSRYLLSAAGDATLRIWNSELAKTPTPRQALQNEGIKLILGNAAMRPFIDREDGFARIAEILEKNGAPKDVVNNFQANGIGIILPLLSLFFAEDEWIAWTPEGYYAASPGGERLMGWHVNNGPDKLASFLPASQFRSIFYRPDVIKLLLKTGSVTKALAEADTARGRMTEKTEVAEVLPPTVLIASPEGSSITADTEEITVRAVAQQVGKHPITSMQLLLDGRPMGGRAGIKQFNAPQREVTERFFVPLEPGVKHTIQVRADSAVSHGLSSLVQVTFKKAEMETKLPSLYVLAIGVKDYEQDALDLRFADEDARRIDRVFREKGAGLFQKIETKLIVNKEATQRGMTTGLSWLKKQMTQHDVGIVFFSGHGDKNATGAFFLLPHDVDPTDLDGTGVSDAQLKGVLQGIPGRVLMMLDACHAGAANGDKRKGATSLTDDLVRDLATDDYGVIVMASSMGREFSLESNDHRAGYFALALNEGLSGKADVNSDKVIYSNELDTYVSERVKSLSKGQQHPVTAKPGTIRSFPLAKQ